MLRELLLVGNTSMVVGDGGQVFALCPTDGADVAYAQQLIADIARRFASDLAFERKPSGACRSCPTHRWCDPPSLGPATSAAEVRDPEIADLDAPF